MIDPATFNTLRQFRAGVYDCFGARRDALFELLDAATVAGLVPSLAYLSLPAVHAQVVRVDGSSSLSLRFNPTGQVNEISGTRAGFGR
jgi:hypothetical protein